MKSDGIWKFSGFNTDRNFVFIFRGEIFLKKQETQVWINIGLKAPVYFINPAIYGISTRRHTLFLL